MSSPDLSPTQKAVLFNTSTSTLSFSTTFTLPPPSTTALLLRVHSTAITNGELTWGPFINPPWPTEHIPCFDVSGTVITSPSSNSKFKPGDHVYGRISAARHGAAAEYTLMMDSEAAVIPKGMGMIEAASVPMSANTAWQALFEQGLLTGSFAPVDVPYIDDKGEAVLGQAAGKRVLILGAAGGVGIMAVQFAKLAGAHVSGTSSTRNIAFLTNLGIDEVIDYTRTTISSYITSNNPPFDLVLDCVGSTSMQDGWHGVAPHGTYISVVPGFTEPECGKPADVRSKFFIMEARGEELERIGRFFEKGMLRTCVDSVWEIGEYEEAFEKTEMGHARGKVVLRVGVGE